MEFFKKTVFILVIITCSLAFGNGGTDETHGGDIVVLEFRELLEQLKSTVRTIPSSYFPIADFASLFERKSEEVLIRSEDRVFIGGDEVNAINYPRRNPPEIVISRSLWKYESLRHTEYRTLVLHEMLYLVGINDDGFLYSRDLYKLITLYEEQSLKNLLVNYIFDIRNPLREKAFYRLEERGMVITHHLEILYNLTLWATQESSDKSLLLTRLALRVARATPDHIFLAHKAGCSIDYLSQLEWPEAKELLRFLKQKNLSQPSSYYCESLRF